ncbi:hypothetical protein [Paenibacillus sp. sgz500958]|uniref:hypothetical protein n=1 Tax=Paenibacillus sp. sgz500958 TaxID=3242475 RepID=UPI0036D35B64
MTKEIFFNLKEVFSPNEKLDRWILKLAIARSDILHVHKRHVDVLQDETNITNGESLYLFRLAISHLREVVKLITFGSNDQEIRTFITGISKEVDSEFNRFIMSKEDPFLNNVLIPTRNNLFHYYDKDKDKEFKVRLEELKDFETKILSASKKIKDTEYEFADQVTLLMSIGDISYDEFKELVKLVSSYMVSFSKVAETITGAFLLMKKSKFRQNSIFKEGGNIL